MKNLIASGGQIKSVDFGIRDSWDFVEAMKETSEDYYKVAAVYRAMNLTADATASIPFAVMKGSEEVDTSAKWKNTVGIMPNPKDLIKNWRLSLFTTNTAYARLAKTNSIKKRLFYVVPDTIEIVTDKKTGMISGYKRKLDGVVVDKWGADDKNFIHMLRTDHTTELLPSANTQLNALANAAGILYSADWWTKNYFMNGAVRPTVLAVKGMPTSEKKNELQDSWSRFMRGIGKGISDLSKLINAESMDVKQIGDGLGDIKDSPVYVQAIENIAMASGIPKTVLMSDSANYATAQTDYAMWFRDSLTPWAYWMQEQMNEQIFTPMGLYFEFRPEQSEPAQEEEVARASAFSQYVTSGIKPSLAAQIVGIDLPAGVEYEDLDEQDEPTEDTPEDTTEDTAEGEDTQMGDDMSTDVKMSAKAWEELSIWKRKAERRQKREQSLDFDFSVEFIPAHIADTIKAGLEDGDLSVFDIKADGYKPPEAVRKNARRGLELREKYGKGGLSTQEAGRQGIGSGVARARNLANGDNISIDTIRRMSAFFSRHEKNKEGGEDDAGYIAWMLWGGDAGRSWVEGILRKEEESKSSNLDEIKALADAINAIAERL